MKIALVSQEYPPETARGGIGSQTYTKAHGLAAKGHKIYVISRSINGAREEGESGNITVIRIPGFEERIADMTEIVQWITHSVVIAAELETLNQLVGLDLIDFPEWGAEGYTYLLNRTEWNKVPVVLQLHGPLVMFAEIMKWPEKDSQFYKVGTLMEETCVKLADSIYSSSRCSANWITEHYHYEKQKIPVIHLGIDTSMFKPQDVPKNPYPTVIFIGKLVANKGIFELVEALILLRHKIPGIRLRIIGKGEPDVIAQLNTMAANAGANDLLDFAGFVYKEDLPIELSKANLFAMPSYYEGGPGFSYLEAMACGIPVIGCSGSGVEEIINNGRNGFLVSPKEVIGLSEVIDIALSDKELNKSMCKNAIEFVRQFADSRSSINNLEAFYKKILEPNKLLQ